MDNASMKRIIRQSCLLYPGNNMIAVTIDLDNERFTITIPKDESNKITNSLDARSITYTLEDCDDETPF